MRSHAMPWRTMAPCIYAFTQTLGLEIKEQTGDERGAMHGHVVLFFVTDRNSRLTVPQPFESMEAEDTREFPGKRRRTLEQGLPSASCTSPRAPLDSTPVKS